MNEATRWRLALAKRIAESYARSPNAEVVMVAGSVGRGLADRYSDIEVDVYYTRPPAEAERVAAVAGCGGVVDKFDQDEDEWEEQMFVDGFHAASSTFLISTMERYLTEVLDLYRIAPPAQTRLYSLQHALTIKGEGQVGQWRARAAKYPEGLVKAMLAEYLPFRGFWYAEEMLASRDDRLLLYHIFVRIGQQILGALLGLNRLYLPTPDHLKGMDEMIGAMRLKPERLSARLKQAFQIEPGAGVALLKEVIVEVLNLVERHVPEFDVSPYRANFEKRRPVWDAPPPGLDLPDLPGSFELPGR
jgi:hypothetical protein